MRLTGTNGTLYLRQADGAWVWVLVGPCEERQEPADIAVGELTCHWNRLCAAFGLPRAWYHHARQPLRRRKHGGRWPSYRDARTRWRAVQYEH